MSFADQLADELRAYIAELKQELATYEQALATLEGMSKVVPHRPAADVTPETVFEMIQDGHRTAAALSRELGVSLPTVNSRLKDLSEANRIRRQGTGRYTQWFTVEQLDPAGRKEEAVEVAPADDVLALVAHGVHLVADLAEQLDVPRRAIYRRLREFEKQGFVEHVGTEWHALKQENWTEYRARELARLFPDKTAAA